jgi:hypothetical protein
MGQNDLIAMDKKSVSGIFLLWFLLQDSNSIQWSNFCVKLLFERTIIALESN